MGHHIHSWILHGGFRADHAVEGRAWLEVGLGRCVHVLSSSFLSLLPSCCDVSSTMLFLPWRQQRTETMNQNKLPSLKLRVLGIVFVTFLIARTKY